MVSCKGTCCDDLIAPNESMIVSFEGTGCDGVFVSTDIKEKNDTPNTDDIDESLLISLRRTG